MPFRALRSIFPAARSAATSSCGHRCWMTRSRPRPGGSLESRTLFLQSPEAPNYFGRRMARADIPQGRRTGQASRRDAARKLFVNSAMVRMQDRAPHPRGLLSFRTPAARCAAAAPKVPMGQWAQIGPVVPHTMLWGISHSGNGPCECQSVQARRRGCCWQRDEGPGRPGRSWSPGFASTATMNS